MSSEQMVKNITELFGNNHGWTMQIKEFAKSGNNIITEVVYSQMINSELMYTKSKIEELQKRLDKIESMV